MTSAPRHDVDGGPTAVDRNGLRVLDRAECLQLLARTTFGRIGVTFGALPVVLPVNYRLVGERILFRTGHGTKLDVATRHSVVAFEVDDIDAVSHSGWSVMVTGEARTVTDPDQLTQLEDSAIPHWARSDIEATVEIATTMISGRWIEPAAEH